MGKRRFISLFVLAMFMLMCFSTLAVAAPVQEGFTVWSGTVAPFDNVKKPWNIKFSAQIRETDVTGDNIYITDVENTVHPASLSLSADGRTVTLNPTKDYTAGSDYRLYIKDQIHDRNGKNLNKAIVMPFKVSASAASLNSNIVISNSSTIKAKDGEVILSNPAASADSMDRHRLAVATPAPNFEYDIRYVAQVLPITVENVSVNGAAQTVTVQANDIFIDQDMAFVSYNYRGPSYAGAVQIINISDAVNPQVIKEIKFNNMDINAVYYDSSTGYLLFGGGADAAVFNTGLTSFIARVNVNNIQNDALILSDIANSITALPSSCVTSICKKGDQYYVSTGAGNGAIIVMDSDMHQVGSRNVEDVRDIDSSNQSLAALAAGLKDEENDTELYPGKLISSLTDSSSDITVSPFYSLEHKSTIDLLSDLPANDKILLDEDGLAFMALADEGFRVVKMGGVDYNNQVVYELPNPGMANPDADPDTVGVAYDGGLIFLANGDYGFQVLRVKGMYTDPVSGAKSINPSEFAELVGYHELTGSIYDDNYYYRANNIAYKKRLISGTRCVEQNVLFVAVGDGGVNIYTLTNRNDYDNTPIPDATWDGIHQILVERHGQDLEGPLGQSDPNIKLLGNAQVNVIFVDEAADYRNALGCFITNLLPSSISSAAEIEADQQMVFENASKAGSGGTLTRGDSRLLTPNPVPAGSYIGSYFLQNGYGNPGAAQFYSIQALNPDGKKHFVAFVDDVNEKIVIALEDLTDLGDKDFNDVVFILDVKPFAAADISNLPKMSDLLNALNAPSILSLVPVTATVGVGETYIMPATVTANMSNGTSNEVAVVWSPNAIDTSTAGTKTAVGTVSGYDGSVQLQVTVQAAAPTIISLVPVTATVGVGESYIMPATVTANMSDGTSNEVVVVWTPSTIDTATAGTKTAIGTVSGYDGTVQLQVTVQATAPSIISLEAVTATVGVGESYIMPATVTANMSDGSSREVAVVWDPEEIDTATAGTKTATGTVSGFDGTVQMQVTVQAPAGSCPDLSKIFAAGVNNDNKAIQLTGSSSIYGNTACNSVLENSVSLAWASIIYGNLDIGPGGSPATVVDVSGWERGPDTNITGSVGTLSEVKTFSLPQFPEFPSLPQRDSIVANSQDGVEITEDGQYSSITVNTTLTIDIGDEDRIIRTGSLNVVNGEIILNRTGNGKLILYVDDTLTVTGDGTINYENYEYHHGGCHGDCHNSDYDSMIIYYAGSQALTVGGNTAIVASLYAEDASVNITGSGVIKGNIISGGTAVSITGNASADEGVVYAPEASLYLSGSSEIEGSAIAKDIKLEGNSFIYYENNINLNFFNLLSW